MLSRVLSLALLLGAATSKADSVAPPARGSNPVLPMATQYIDCDPDDPSDVLGKYGGSAFVLSPFCENLDGFSRVVSCQEGKVDIFLNGRLNCEGTPDVTRPLNECAASVPGGALSRYVCEDFHVDAELYRRRFYYNKEDGKRTPDCSGSYVFSSYTPVNQCVVESNAPGGLRSVRFVKINDTAMELSVYNSTDCLESTEYQKTVEMADPTYCNEPGQRSDIVTLRNVTAASGNLRNTILNAIQGHT